MGKKMIRSTSVMMRSVELKERENEEKRDQS